MIDDSHPYHFLRPLLLDVGCEFSFSRYMYVPDSLFDERECFTLKGGEISEDVIKREISALKEGQELAIHSIVKKGGRTWHIPMVDFSVTDGVNRELFHRMQLYMPKRVLLNMEFYFSGRSFHGYSRTLISPKEWLDFMGRLLLINHRSGSEFIDSRWIGHRLIGGFSSLRWSNNSGLYEGVPMRVDIHSA